MNKILFKEKINSFIFTSVIKVIVWGIELLIKRADHLRRTAINKVYIKSIDIFPNNTLSQNHQIHSEVMNKISSERPLDPEMLSDDAKILHKYAVSNNEIKTDLSRYYLAIAFAYSQYSKIFSTFSEKEEYYLAKAKAFDSSADVINEKELYRLIKQYKKKTKLSNNQLSEATRDKISNESHKIIGVINISISEVISLISLTSVLFLISGYFYVEAILNQYGIDSSDFYNTSDYISASLTYAKKALLYSVFFLFFFIFLGYRTLKRRVTREQFDLPPENRSHAQDPVFWGISSVIFTNTCVIIAFGFLSLEIPFQLVATNILFVILAFLEKIPFRIFKSPFKVLTVLLFVLFYFYNLYSGIQDNLNALNPKVYVPRYKVTFHSKELEQLDLKFLAINSSHLFMLHNNNKDLIILKPSDIKQLTPNTLAK